MDTGSQTDWALPALTALSGRKAPGCGWLDDGWGLWEMWWSHAHPRVEPTSPGFRWHEGHSRGSADAGQQDHVRSRGWMLRATDLLLLPWLLSSGLLCPPLATGVCRSLQSGKHMWMDSKLSQGNLPSCFSPGEAWPLDDCYVGLRLSPLRSALTFWTKYCCCYSEKSRDNLASVFTQTANSNSAVQSTQLRASSSEHLSPGAHWQESAPFLPDWCLRLPGRVWSALTERAAPLGWGSHVSPSPLTSGAEIIW